MSSQAAAESDFAAGVVPSSPWRVKALTVLPGYRLAVTFNDGRQGIVDFSAVRTSADAGVYAELAAPNLFAAATIELGVVTWPNGADLDPVWMHEELRDRDIWSVPV